MTADCRYRTWDPCHIWLAASDANWIWLGVSLCGARSMCKARLRPRREPLRLLSSMPALFNRVFQHSRIDLTPRSTYAVTSQTSL